MQEAAENLLLVLVALFPIVDPLGGSPFFLALTREYAPEARRALSWRIAMNSFFLLVGSYFVGTYVLAFFGISLPVVQLGGGLIVIATASFGITVELLMLASAAAVVGACSSARNQQRRVPILPPRSVTGAGRW